MEVTVGGKRGKGGEGGEGVGGGGGGVLISLSMGDITEEDTDAIVNAANSRLSGGGGVDGAIHRAGGPRIMEECRKIGSCPTGSAVITTGGDLKARYVIHTVGPVYRDGTHGEPGLLESSYRLSLKIAEEKGLKSVSFPSISTGAYGYPIEEASGIALKTVIDYVNARRGGRGGRGGTLKLVRFVLFSDRDIKTYTAKLKELTA